MLSSMDVANLQIVVVGFETADLNKRIADPRCYCRYKVGQDLELRSQGQGHARGRKEIEGPGRSAIRLDWKSRSASVDGAVAF